MKKRIIISVLTLVIIVFSLSWILNIKRILEEKDSRNYISEIEISGYNISSSGMQIKISNKGDGFYSFTDDTYSIQQYKRNRWIDLIDERTERTSLCDDVGLYPDRDYDFYLKWEWVYGKLENGKYRILFPVYDSSDTYWITTEFVISGE